MEYNILIEEVVSENYKIEANSEKEAIKKVEKLYKNGEIILEPGNILTVSFKIK